MTRSQDPRETDPGPREAPPSGGATEELLRRLSEQRPRPPRYRLDGEVARGGMGAILRVWDEDLRRHLAMKVVLGRAEGSSDAATPAADAKVLGRFLEEAQVTGQLDHPGIVPVHELGLDAEGRVYFTMKLVKGRDLKQVFDQVFANEDGWNETRALGVLLKACEAMAYAHRKGVIHRDLKPANVMVGHYGEVFVMDWGLARVLGRKDAHDIRLAPEASVLSSSVRTERRSEREDAPDSPLVTMDGDVMGTPAYMPPEQARGEIEKLSPRSDVYSIGAMLYHLLSRHMPFVPPGARMSNRTVLLRVIEGPPRPLHELRRDVPAELAAICDKAMARESEARYPDTLALAEDLRAYLEHRVVGAYETGALAEGRKWIARNRPLAAALAATLLALVAGLSASLVLKQRSDLNAVRADESAKLADERARLARTSEERATAEAARATEQARKSRAVQDFLKAAFRAANPETDTPADYRVRDLLDRASERLAHEFEADREIRGVLHGVMAHSYRGLGDSEKALAHVEAGIADLEASGRRDSLEMVQGLHLRGELLMNSDAGPPDRLDRAQRGFEESLEILAGLPGDHSMQEVLIRGSLAYVGTLRRGRLDRSDPWPEETVRFIALYAGRTDYETVRKELNEKMWLIVRTWTSGRKQEAKDLLRADYLPYLKTPESRAMVSNFLGRMGYQALLSELYEFAEPVLELSLDVVAEVAEPSRSAVMSAKGGLASLYMSQRRWADARRVYDEILPVAVEILGPVHDRTLMYAQRQSRVLRNMGEPGVAVRLLRPLIEEMVARSVSQVEVVNMTLDLGMSLERAGGQEEALECFRSVLSAAGAGPSPPARFQALLGAGRSLRKLSRETEAEACLLEAWSLCSALDDPLLRSRAECAIALAEFYDSAGRPESGQEFLRAAGCESAASR